MAAGLVRGKGLKVKTGTNVLSNSSSDISTHIPATSCCRICVLLLGGKRRRILAIGSIWVSRIIRRPWHRICLRLSIGDIASLSSVRVDMRWLLMWGRRVMLWIHGVRSLGLCVRDIGVVKVCTMGLGREGWV